MEQHQEAQKYQFSHSISKFVFTVIAIVVFVIAILFSFHFAQERLNGLLAFIAPGLAVSALAIVYLSIKNKSRS